MRIYLLLLLTGTLISCAGPQSSSKSDDVAVTGTYIRNSDGTFREAPKELMESLTSQPQTIGSILQNVVVPNYRERTCAELIEPYKNSSLLEVIAISKNTITMLIKFNGEKQEIQTHFEDSDCPENEWF